MPKSIAKLRRQTLHSPNPLRLLNSHRDADGIDNLAEHVFGVLRFFLEGCMSRARHHAMGKHGDCKLFEIVGEAEVASIEEGAGLRGALEHQSATRADAEG